MQDLGAAGITCALSETAAAGRPRRRGQPRRRPAARSATWSRGRSACRSRRSGCSRASRPTASTRAIEICAKWGLDATVVARYADGRTARPQGRRRAARRRPGGIARRRSAVRASGRRAPTGPQLHALDPLELTWPSAEEILLRVLASPSIASQGVGLAAVRPHGPAQHARRPGGRRRRAAPARVAARRGRASPASRSPPTAPDASRRSTRTSAARSRCASRRATSRVWAPARSRSPNCLNFGSPERPEVMGDFAAAVRGLGDACRAFGIPVIGGNVSFYNESPPGASTRRRSSGCSACSTTCTRTARRSRATATRSSCSARRVRSSAGARRSPSSTTRSPDVRRRSTWGPRSRSRSCSRRRRSAPTRTTCPKAGSASRSPSCASAPACGATVTLADGDPLWTLFGESTARALLTCAPDDVDAVLARGRDARRAGARDRHARPAPTSTSTGVLRVAVDDLARHLRRCDPGPDGAMKRLAAWLVVAAARCCVVVHLRRLVRAAAPTSSPSSRRRSTPRRTRPSTASRSRGSSRPAITTRMEIIQDPPVTSASSRRRRSRPNGKPSRSRSWLVHNADGDFACNELRGRRRAVHEDRARRGRPSARRASTRSSTRRARRARSPPSGRPSRTERIQGQQGDLLRGGAGAAVAGGLARPSPRTSASATSSATRRTGSCSAGKRTTLDDAGSAANAESFVEALSVSRAWWSRASCGSRARSSTRRPAGRIWAGSSEPADGRRIGCDGAREGR